MRSMSFIRRLLSWNSARLPSIKSLRNVADRKSFKYVMVGLGATLAGASSAAGYATYAYSVDEFEEKTRALRSLTSNKAVVGDDAFSLAKFQAAMFSFAIAVPAKATELYLNLRRSIEKRVQEFTEPLSDKLLPDRHPKEQHAFTLVLDLNETLVCSDWELARGSRTYKRPGTDAFLKHLTKYYEIVVYSDQREHFVEIVVESLDPKRCISYKLNRGATKYQNGNRYRDLSKLNRDPEKIIYVSGHALETCLQPENSLEIKPWRLETDDTELADLTPFLEYVAIHKPPDIRPVLASYRVGDLGKEFIKHSVENRKKFVDTVTESLDPKHCIRYKLNRGATKYQTGNRYRDLSKLITDPKRIIYLIGHAPETCLQPENSIEIKPWRLETDDIELADLIPFLENVATHKPRDIRDVLASYRGRQGVWERVYQKFSRAPKANARTEGSMDELGRVEN